MAAKKERHPLTEEQRALVAEAWELIATTRQYWRREQGKWIDTDGAIAERLIEMAPNFDGSKSKLKTWAIYHAHYAVQDELRRSGASGNRHRKGRKVTIRHTASLDAIIGQHGISILDFLGAPDPPTAADQAESLTWLTRGLTAVERAAVLGSIVEGRTLRAIGQDHEISESRIHQIRAQALDLLRQREAM